MKKNLAVIFGGASSEHDISCISANGVLSNIDKSKYNIYMLGITKVGEWYLFNDDIALLPQDKWLNSKSLKKAYISPDSKIHGIVTEDGEQIKIDVAFPILHGKNGEDGTIQGLFQLAQIPFVGCDVTASAIGMDKYITKLVLKESNVPVLDARLYTLSDYADMESMMNDIENVFGYPVIVKPVNLGSSVGISVAKSRVELANSVDDAFRYATKVLVEHAITNLREINCSVLGDENDAIASECEEPLHTKDILSYEDKYVSNAKGSGSKGMASVSRRIPAELTPEKREEVRELAVRSFKALGCNGVSRIDFMIDADTDKLYFNEINTIPGSLAFYLWEPVGVPYKELLDRMIQLALKRERTEESLTFTFDTNILNQASFGGSKGSKM